MNRIVRFALIIGIIALAGCDRDASFIGSYIGGDDSGHLMIEINSIKDHEIAGKMMLVENDSSGKVTAFDRPIEGGINGGAISLSVNGAPGISLITGQITGDKMDLTMFVGDQPQKYMLTRGDQKEFMVFADGVQKRAASIKEAAAAAALYKKQTAAIAAQVQDKRNKDIENQNSINDLTDMLKSKSERFSGIVVKIDQVIRFYDITSARSAILLAHKSRLDAQHGSDNFESGQIDFSHDQVRSEAANMHEAIQAGIKTINDAATQNEATWEKMTALCRFSTALDCSNLQSAMPIYRSRVAEVRAAANREQMAFARKREKL